MTDLKSELYISDIKYVEKLDLPWDNLQDNSILLSGASGMIGSCLIDVIMMRNFDYGLNCKVYALGRNLEKAMRRFSYCWNDVCFNFIVHDINNPINFSLDLDNCYILHLASNTHPVAYSTDPIGTIMSNTIGLNNMLEFASKNHAKRFVFASSNEIYGENRGDAEFFDENYCGYIDSNTLRAGYPESKRCGESLCQAYLKQKDLDIVIPRFTRTYGPTMQKSDTKAISQFILNGVEGKDIVLKSEGTQYYSYTYVTDAVSGLLTVLLKGRCGEAYNISDQSGDIRLKDLADIIAEHAGTNVVYKMPDDLEKAGYSKATKARINGNKIKKLGWRLKYNIKLGIERTLDILKESNNC